jgi:Carboxyl transferase domain/Domain of unknown function (DUF5011)
MPAIRSNVIVESDDFRANRATHLHLIAEFRALERKVCEASARSDAKFRARGQLPPRMRVNLILDRDSPFLELSSLCGLGMHEDDGVDNVFGGGSIVGIGMVSGARCMVAASDSGIKGGAAHPMGVEKAIRAQEIALANKLPYVQLVESAGANLMLQAEMFVRGGATFANMARLSAAGIPVISIVHGSSTAGGAYQTGLADYVVMVRGRSKVFLAGPPLLRAATGEIAGDEALGGAELHCAVTGLGEYLAEDDADALRIGREILARIGWGRPAPRPRAPAPLYDPEELLGIVPVDYRKPYEVREAIARLVDGSEFLDFKPLYGVATVCGHAAIEGRPVGLIGNNGPIDSAGSSKELTSLTSTVAGFAQSITSAIGNFGQLNTQQLCVSDGANDPNPVCITKARLATLLASANQSATAPDSSPASPPSTSDATNTPAVIQINGDNPAIVQVGATYSDLGATITGPQADLNLGIETFLNGVLVSPIVIDTSAVSTDTIDYVATDQNGLTSTSTRTVIVEPAATPSAPTTSASSTAATSTVSG